MDKTLEQKILNTRLGSETLLLRKEKAGKIDILGTREEREAFAEGRITVEEQDLPGYQKVQVLKEMYQGLVGPNHLWYFTPNVEKIMWEAKFAAVDLRIWNRLLRKLWYYNYVLVFQSELAKKLEITPTQISNAIRKFREYAIIETVEPEQTVPKELSKMKGVWYRISLDMVWMGPVHALERCPEGYTLIRRKTSPPMKTLKESFEEMKKRNRV